MYRRSLFVIIFTSFFLTIWSLRCYEGNSTTCKLGENTDDSVSDVKYLCISYHYKCSPTNSDCNEKELAAGGLKWEFLIADQLGCDYLKATDLYNVTCCSTDKCNQPPSGLCCMD